MKKEMLAYAGDHPAPSLAQLGYRSFGNAREMLIELRKHVMLKWMRAQHEMELSEPGENTHGFVGTPEW